MDKNNLSWGKIDRILMVGGSSRMPMVEKLLRELTKRTLDRSLPPDVAIAKGGRGFTPRGIRRVRRSTCGR